MKIHVNTLICNGHHTCHMVLRQGIHDFARKENLLISTGSILNNVNSQNELTL